MFKVVILNPKRVMYEGSARRVFLPGDCGEFEVLEFHKSIISLLKKGEILIDGKISVPVSRGIARMDKDSLTVLAEE